ncbi:Norsolorinic acid ketoreductase 2 [Diaporthe amygdali]|uniref:Norsolorinic acid ketoreductase 2 n=1 Tax=Phomopsis amygdali TaxID=1214568 RepID=UPI0022FE6531|nr:Norsolorinic acid ketoreductase 2 [Diaporthe amygdali]KAJ0104067.1 Norsolorinic acid ketoreductase 2 [Diaporthe amygdali]
MSSPATYFVTGANRGIGRGFVERFLQKPSTTVIAAVRDPSHPTSKALADLPKAPETRLIVVKLDSTVQTDAASAVAELSEQGITSLDVVIANAGIAQDGSSVRNTSVANTQKHFDINVIGPLTLFQATADMLQASKTGSPKFVTVSTVVGSIGSQETFATFPRVSSPYGASKAALNWFIRLLAFEEPWLTSWTFHPGLVETDLTSGGNMDLKALGAISVETSVADMTKIIWSMESKELSGTFRNHDGTMLPW